MAAHIQASTSKKTFVTADIPNLDIRKFIATHNGDIYTITHQRKSIPLQTQKNEIRTFRTMEGVMKVLAPHGIGFVRVLWT